MVFVFHDIPEKLRKNSSTLPAFKATSKVDLGTGLIFSEACSRPPPTLARYRLYSSDGLGVVAESVSVTNAVQITAHMIISRVVPIVNKSLIFE